MKRCLHHILRGGIWGCKLPKSGVAAGCLLVLLVSTANAQQGWQTVVNAEPDKAAGFGTTVVVPARPQWAANQGRKPTPPIGGSQTRAQPRVGEKVELGVPQQRAELTTPDSGTAEQQTVKHGSASLAQQYCANIVDAAAEARSAWQKRVLLELEEEVNKRVALLEAKTAEYQKWLTRRDEFARKAQEGLVTIYSRMRPDAAALQLTSMDEEAAAAILMKLEPRAASNVLNEMAPAKAARLTSTMSGAARVPRDAGARAGSGTGEP